MRLPGHKHEVLGLLSARDFKTPRFSPGSSRPQLLFADARPTLPQIKSSCNATGDAGQVGRDPLGEQGHQPRAQGQTGPSSPHQPQSRGRGKPGPRGAELLSAHPLAGALIAFQPPPKKLLLILIGHSGDGASACSSPAGPEHHHGASATSCPPATSPGQGTRGLGGLARLMRTSRSEGVTKTPQQTETREPAPRGGWRARTSSAR